MILKLILLIFSGNFSPQGEKNFSFVLFILKHMGIQTPSLSAIKTFKLPGRQIPARVSDKNITFS